MCVLCPSGFRISRFRMVKVLYHFVSLFSLSFFLSHQMPIKQSTIITKQTTIVMYPTKFYFPSLFNTLSILNFIFAGKLANLALFLCSICSNSSAFNLSTSPAVAKLSILLTIFLRFLTSFGLDLDCIFS